MSYKYLLFIYLIISFISCKIDPLIPVGDGHNHTHFDLNIPAGLPVMNIPKDNPMTVEGIALGRKLFYDPILSADSTMSCASCHQFKNFFVDSTKAVSTGIDGIAGTRNSMPLFNIGYNKSFMWDGGIPDLESQVLAPIANPIELHEDISKVIFKLQRHPLYPTLFAKAFGSDKIITKNIMYAIAQFERTMISANSRFDKWKRGEISLTAQEMRGMEVYTSEEKGDCVHCHSFGSVFTDYEFRNTGLDSIPIDKGRALITLKSEDEGKFKTPTLRNIARTAPYMHDGRFTTLHQCVQHYNRFFKYTKNLASELAPKPKNRMSDQDVSDLVAFLETLTDEEFLNNTALDNP